MGQRREIEELIRHRGIRELKGAKGGKLKS